MIKTALFYILAFNRSHKLLLYGHTALRNALAKVKGSEDTVRDSKLKYKSDAEWTTDEDVDQHGEEARVVTEQIFTLIKCLAEEGWKLRSFWDRLYPISNIGGFGGEPISQIRGNVFEKKLFGEADYIRDICNLALGRLDRNTFYDKK